MKTIIDVRRELDQINAKYDDLIAPLKAKILEFEQLRINETSELKAEYEAMTNQIIDDHRNGVNVKIAGVQIRQLNDFEIVDTSLIPQEYMKLEINKSKIKDKLKETDYTEKIPGVSTFIKYSVAIKL